jgi:hypothetical protein
MNSIEYLLQGITYAIVLVLVAGLVGLVLGWLF